MWSMGWRVNMHHTDVSIKCYFDCKSIYRYTTKAVCNICRIANNHTFATVTTEKTYIFFINRTSKLDHTFFYLLQKVRSSSFLLICSYKYLSFIHTVHCQNISTCTVCLLEEYRLHISYTVLLNILYMCPPASQIPLKSMRQ